MHLTDDTFNEAIKENRAVVLDFWAPWCGPCKMLGPVIDSLAQKHGDSVTFCKMNVDENSEIPGKFNVMSIPTLVFFKDGVKVGEMLGLVSDKDIEDQIEKLLR